VIADRYGDQIAVRVNWTDTHFPSNSSTWWKDLRGIESNTISPNWVSKVLKRKIGNGDNSSFWLVNWIGGMDLCEKFPRLYSLSEQKEVAISEVVGVGFVRSALIWRRRLFDWEEGLVEQLENLLRNVTLSLDCDKRVWSLEVDGVFSVKSAYNHLASVLNFLPPMPAMKASVFRNIWSSPAPSKIIAFSWQLLYNRLPSKSNLSCRGVGAVGKRERKGFLLVWHTTLWFLWKTRNGLIFKNVQNTKSGGRQDYGDVVEMECS
jgi:hypothetical protein